MAWESLLQSGFKSHLHKRRNVRFKGLRRVHTPPQPLTAHAAAHTAKQRVFRMGWYHYPRTVWRGSEPLRGRVSERHTLPLLGLGRERSRRTQSACGTAMRSCASLSRWNAQPRCWFLRCIGELHGLPSLRRNSGESFHAPCCADSIACTRCRSAVLSSAVNCRS